VHRGHSAVKGRRRNGTKERWKKPEGSSERKLPMKISAQVQVTLNGRGRDIKGEKEHAKIRTVIGLAVRKTGYSKKQGQTRGGRSFRRREREGDFAGENVLDVNGGAGRPV